MATTYEIRLFVSSKFYILFVSLSFTLRIQSTFLNIEELQKSRYGVEISAKPVLLNNQDQDESIMKVISKHGQQYQCVLPLVQFETKELHVANVTKEEIDKLLQPLNNTCIYQLTGWWSYRVCIGRSIYQYHDEGYEVKDNISLGHFSESTDWSNLTIKAETRGDKRYHSQFYNNGTICDLTGKPRKTEVRFFCGSQNNDVLSRIDESSTCNYVITIHTHRLCNHSLFRPPPKPQKHNIVCSPALKEDQYKKYTESQNKKSEKSIKDEQYVSDIESKDNNNEASDLRRSPNIEDIMSSFYHKENIKESQESYKLKEAGEKAMKLLKEKIDKSLKQIKLATRRELLQDENEEANFEEATDNDDEDDEEYDEHIGEDLDREDDVRWDVDPLNDDDSMDIEGSSTLSQKLNTVSSTRKDEEEDSSDVYQELIERLKKQYHILNKQLDSVINNMKTKIKRLKGSTGFVNPSIQSVIATITKSVDSLGNKQRIAKDAMKRLSDLYDAVMENPDYVKANEELASIESTLLGLIDKVNSNSNPLEPNDNTHDYDIEDKVERKNQPYKPSEEIFKPHKKIEDFDIEKPNLDKVVSKLKKIMTRENADGDKDEIEDDRISVRVTKVKEKSDDLYDYKDFDKSFIEDSDDNQLDEVNEDKEMKAATKKMENLVRKKLEDAGINHEGKIKVKIITSKEALRRVVGGEDKFQILTSDETNQFRNLISNLLGGSQQLMEEKKRQEVLEDNYNLVWNQDGFTSATASEKYSSLEQDDDDK